MGTELFNLNRAATTVTSGGTDAPAQGTQETWTVASSAMFGAAATGVSQFHVDCITTEPVTHHETGAVIHQAGAVVWHSHMDDAIHPEHRLNPDHPAEDHQGDSPVPVTQTSWCDACREYAAAKGLLP